MTGENLIASADLVLRGGVCLLLLLLAAMMVRDHGRAPAARLGAFFALGAAAYALCSSASFHAQMGVWAVPIMALATGNNLIFWLFARSLFDDDFHPRAWQAGLWLAIVALGLVEALTLQPSHPMLSALAQLTLTLTALAFAILATAQTLNSWPADLVEPRRRLRLFIVAASSAYIVLNTLANLLGLGRGAPHAASLLQAIGLAVIAGGAAWSLLQVAGGAALFPQPAETAPDEAPQPEPADPALVALIDRAMGYDRVYRQDGLTIGALAQRLGLPEYRLRRLINQGLGERNFNAFLNRYRIADACAALADPDQAEVPVLTIALDAGFSSLGPFNRAFKAETGLTPSEYRRAALAEAGVGTVISISAGRISNSA
jgi:AraC-like DNA-binding protein